MQRYENVSQRKSLHLYPILESHTISVTIVYGTNDPSDDTTEQDVSISVSNILVGLSVPASPKAQQDEPKKGEKTPSEATKNFDNGKASCTVLETQAVSIDAFCAKVTATKSKPLRRTTSQAIREAVFGSSDEELSEIDSPTPAPPKVPSRSKSQRCNSSAPKRAQGRIVLDSDEEEIVTSARPAKATISKKKHVESSEDEIEEILSPPMLLSISRRPSALNLVPVTPACRTTEMVRTSETLRPNVASSRTDSKKGYPLALATDTAIVISGRSTRSRSSLKAASVSKDPDPSKSAVSSIPQPPITVNLGPLEAPLDINAEDSNTEKASKRNGVHRGSGKHGELGSLLPISPFETSRFQLHSVPLPLHPKSVLENL